MTLYPSHFCCLTDTFIAAHRTPPYNVCLKVLLNFYGSKGWMSTRKKLLVSFYIAQYHMIYNQAEHNRNNNPLNSIKLIQNSRTLQRLGKNEIILHTKFNCEKRREGNLRFFVFTRIGFSLLDGL